MRISSTFLRFGAVFSFGAIIVIFAASCKKDSNSSSNAVEGNWTFVSMSANTQSTVWDTVGDVPERIVTVSTYTTTNNSGTVIIKADSMHYVGLSYKIAGTATGTFYEDDQLVDTYPSPFEVTIPAMNGASKYQLIGKDSLYFPGGGAFSGHDLGGAQQTIASGGKFTLNGGTLTMTSSLNQTATTFENGAYTTKNSQAAVTTILQRQ